MTGSWDRVIDGASATFGGRLDLRSPGDAMPAGARCNLRLSDTIESSGKRKNAVCVRIFPATMTRPALSLRTD